MEFGSKFILANDEDAYESVSDEEYEEGMCVSDSDSDGEAPAGGSASRGKPRGLLSFMKKKSKHHWRQPSSAPSTKASSAGEKEVSSKYARKGKKLQFRRADTNVVSVNFSTLLSPGNMYAGEPVLCKKCSSILSNISKVHEETKVWQCEFCDEAMPVDLEPEEIPTAEDVTFLLEPALTTTTSTMTGLDQSLVIFCVDVSGSMCVTSEVAGKIKLRGSNQLNRLQTFNEANESQYLPSQRDHSVTYISRLQAMQAAVDHQLGEMAKHHPNRRVALITFNNEVTIIGDGTQEEITVAGDKLNNAEELCKAGADAPMPQAVSGSREVLGEKVYNLEEGGATALGPALTVAVNMAARHAGSKVILCTDGKANIGLGKLEDTPNEEEALDFYTEASEDALSKGVTVSVISIQGTNCKLVHLGMLADKTGGQVNIVDPLKLTEEFGNILADPIIATKVKATFLVHKELYIIDEKNPESQLCQAEYNAGNVKSSTSITFEFAKRKSTQRQTETVQEKVISEQPEEDTVPMEVSAAAPNTSKEETASKDQKLEEPATSEGEKCTAETGKQDTAAGGEKDPADKEESSTTAKSAEQPPMGDFPFQLQIEYTDTEGNKALRVITRKMPATTDRKTIEDNANLEILGAHAAKKSADLALQGQFSKSRGVALMNQRLAWRVVNCSEEPPSAGKKQHYRNIFGKIKSVENYVQRQQFSEIDQYGRTRSDSESDEDIEEMGGADDLLPPLLLGAPVESAQPRSTAPLSKCAKKQKKIHSARSSEIDDVMANAIYGLRSAEPSRISSLPEEAPRQAASGSKSPFKKKD